MLRPLALAVLLVLPLSAYPQGQNAANRQNMEAMLVLVREFMLPMVTEMTTAMMETQFTVLSERKSAAALARFTRNHYEELIEAGFTPEDALDVSKAVGVPVIPISMGQK